MAERRGVKRRTAASLSADGRVPPTDSTDRLAPTSADVSPSGGQDAGEATGAVSFDRCDPGSDYVHKLATDARRSAGQNPEADPAASTLTVSELSELGDALARDIETIEGPERVVAPPKHLLSALQRAQAKRPQRKTS
jgi:hypothetical protein